MIAPRRNSLPLDQAENGEGAEFEVLQEDVDEDDTTTAGTSRSKPQAKPSKTVKATGKPKRKEDIGPSGMAYTPLEKQARVVLQLWSDGIG